MQKNKILVLGLIGVLIAGFGIYNLAKAATTASVYASPASASKNVGDTFTISIGVSPSEGSVDTVEGTLNLSNLTCQSVVIGSGVLPVSSPSCSNLYFALGITGGTTESKTLFTVTVQAASAGTATATLSRVSVLSAGNVVTSSASNGSYTITAPAPTEPEPTPATPATTTTINPPTNLSASDVPNDNGTAIQISWKASPTSDITGYFILRKLSSETYYKSIATVAKNTLSYTDTTCVPGTTYDYSVVAYKGTNWSNSTRSSFSAKVTATAINNLGTTEETTPTETAPTTETESKFEISVDETGKVTTEFVGVSTDSNMTITVPKDIIVTTEAGEPVKEITAQPTTVSEETITSGTFFVAGTAYDFGPDGTTFSEPIEITIKYDPTNLPEGMQESDLVIKMFDGEKWVSLPTTIDTENHIATAMVSHFTTFALFAEEKKVTISPIETTPYEEPSNWQLIVGLVIAILAIVGFIVYYKKQK